MKTAQFKFISILTIIATLVVVGVLIIPDLKSVNARDFLEGFVIGIGSVMLVVWVVVFFKNWQLRKNEKDETMIQDLKQRLNLIIGMIALAVTIIINRVKPDSELFAIISIISALVAIVFLVKYLVIRRRINAE